MLEKLSKALGEELSKQVEEAIKTSGIELAIFNDGSVVPSEKFDALKDEIKATNEKLEESNNKLTELSKGNATAEEIKLQLEQVQADFETFKSDTSKRDVDRGKKEALKKLFSKSINPDAIDLVVDTIDLNGVMVNEAGEVVDGQSKVDKIIESRPSLKLVTEVSSNNVPSDKQTIVATDYSKMTDAEYFAHKRETKEG